MQGDTAGANRVFGQVFELLGQIGRQDSTDAAFLLHNWALNTALTNPLEALTMHRRVIGIFEGDDPDSVPVPARLNLGIQLNRLARYGEARSVLETARRLGKRHENPTMIGVSAQGIACACRALGDLACAHKALAESADALKAFPAEHRAVAILAREKGLLAAAEGHVEEARRLLSSALELHAKVGERDVSHIETLLDLGRLELRSGDRAKVGELARAALDRAETLRGGTPHSAWVGLSELLLGELSEAQGDVSVARKRFEDAVDHMVSTLGDAHPDVLEARAHLAALDK